MKNDSKKAKNLIGSIGSRTYIEPIEPIDLRQGWIRF